jgi:outer membrane protein OmpA-like peptidoglycan-associated protein
MSLTHFPTIQRSGDEAEKPFWISYADLMTALMVLFLVIMVTSLSLISTKVQEAEIEIKVKAPQPDVPTDVRMAEISNICTELSERVSKVTQNAKVDCKLNRINFGAVGRFRTDEYKLNPEGERALVEVVPAILETANTPTGKKWLKQVLIEGFTDTDGSYLYNLNLSLKRSEWVMCTLLRNDSPLPVSLTPDQRRQIKQLFLAGGVAFNNIQQSKDASRRVELRLQFYGLDRKGDPEPTYNNKFDDAPNERCHI